VLAHSSFQTIEPVLAEQLNRSLVGCKLLQGVISRGDGQAAGSGSSPSRDYATRQFPTSQATRPGTRIEAFPGLPIAEWSVDAII
jgi:hypothetical protein